MESFSTVVLHAQQLNGTPCREYHADVGSHLTLQSWGLLQVCLFDLDYGLPVQVRDTALGIEKEDIPESDVGKEFQLNEQIQRGQTESSFGGGSAASNDMLMQLQRTAPYYKRNQARICSFFVKGQCTRGAECPYRHEMPVQNELSEQNIKDRYYGINDPVANKLLRRYTDQPKLEPPEDR